MKKAIVIGCLGQDGSFLAELLQRKGYKIYGFVREGTPETRIKHFHTLVPDATIIPINILNKWALLPIIRLIQPDEIYNFAGYSNVINPWSELETILDINGRVPQILLDIILKVDKSIKFFQASSCLTFGKDSSGIQNENTSANPIHLYGITKLYADKIIKEFRDTFGLYACSGIFFNHESERRSDIFFSRKISRAVARIHLGNFELLKIGNLSAVRDYGYAPDFMKAVYMMMNNTEPKDYVIGTGILTSMEEFVKRAFQHVSLEYKDHIEVSDDLLRKNDTAILKADISKITKDLGWTPDTNIDSIIRRMVDYDVENYKLAEV